MEQNELCAEWRSTSERVFFGILVVSISSIFVNIYDAVSDVLGAMQSIMSYASYAMGDDVDFSDSIYSKIGIGAKVVLIVGYVLYFIGLTSFAQIQRTEKTSGYVYKARTALILLIISSVFGFMGSVPLIGFVFKFVKWLLLVIGYIVMRDAYAGLMQSDDFDEAARRGARNVKYAAVCELRLLFLPIMLILIFFIIFVLFSSSISFTGVDSMSLQHMFASAQGFFYIICFISIIAMGFALVWGICAFVWPIMGWYRIMCGGPADITTSIEENSNDELENVSSEETYVSNAETIDGTSELSEEVEEQQEPAVVYDFELEDEDEKKKKWYIGGASAAILIAVVVCFFAFGGSSKNNPLGVQKPKWEKFVKVNESNVKLYKEADVSSAYIQFAVEDCECDMPDERYVWSDDKAPRGYKVNDYDVEMNTVYPVLDESDGWYRVHFGVGEIQEAYIQKTSCEEVKPEPITKKIIEKVYGNDKGACKFVEKGEFANLFILREPFSFGVEENVSMGVLIDGCIVMPAECLCFPQESDSADVSIFNVSNSLEYKLWHLNCPQNYWEETQDAEFPTAFNVNNLTESDIQKMVMALRPQGSTSSTVYYYFPTVADDRFIEFQYSFSPAVASEVEEDKAVTKYEVKNDMLMAEINGEMVNTEVDGEMGIDLLGTFDLDGDGSMECAVWVNSGGNIVNPAKVITYDVENDKFVEAGDLEYTEAPTVEDKDGKTVLLQRAGLRWILYAMEDHKLKRVEDEVKMVGSVRNTIEVDNIYGEDEQGDVKITQDFDGDGNDDELTFSRDLSHAGGYGQWMGLNTVVLADGTSHDLGLMASKFNILNQTTNGMPDIIADNYLYRWDGSGYESYVWDGNNIVKGQ